MDRLGLALRVARADHEEVGVARRSRAGRSRGCPPPCGRTRSPRSARPAPSEPLMPALRSATPPCRVEPVLGDVRGHPVGHQVADRLPARRPAAEVARRDLDQRHVEVADRSRPQAGDPTPISLRAQPTRSTAATVASSSTSLGLVPGRQRRRLVAAQDQVQLVVRAALAQRPRACPTCRTAPSRSSSSRDTSKRSSSAVASSAISSRTSAPGSPSSSRCGASPDRHEQHPVQLELDDAPPARRPGGPVRRVERPAEDPRRISGDLLPDLPRALDDELVGGQLAQRRSARAHAASGSSCRSRRPCRRRRRR